MLFQVNNKTLGKPSGGDVSKPSKAIIPLALMVFFQEGQWSTPLLADYPAAFFLEIM